ncbi:MAG: phage baseplate assembly protein V [Pseudomonadota bacterium]|nr:phage baseplate assembly protein V [Pseudomonadota bacterium]
MSRAQNNYAQANIDRMLANLIRIGRISAVDHAQAVATVDFDGEVVPDLLWSKQRMGDDRYWHAPSVGEQVIVLSVSGDLSQGVIIAAIAQDQFADVAQDAHPKIQFSDGTIVRYDKSNHTLTVDASASSSTVHVLCDQAQVVAASQVTIDTPQTTITGDVTIQKNLNVTINTNVGGSLGVTGDSTISGSANFTGGAVTHQGKNIGASHTHSGVDAGGDNTGGVV